MSYRRMMRIGRTRSLEGAAGPSKRPPRRESKRVVDFRWIAVLHLRGKIIKKTLKCPLRR
jgi:hypothetical protein